MKTCRKCGLTTDASDLTCPVCGTRLPLSLGPSGIAWRKLGLAILIPFLVYIAMTALLK